MEKEIKALSLNLKRVLLIILILLKVLFLFLFLFFPTVVINPPPLGEGLRERAFLKQYIHNDGHTDEWRHGIQRKNSAVDRQCDDNIAEQGNG